MSKKCLRNLALLLCGCTQGVFGANLEVDLQFSLIGGGVFQYDVAVRNNGPSDVSIVSITDAPSNDPLIVSTLEAPPGFMAFYDPGIGMGFGFVDFIEDVVLFAANTTTSGFRFQSESSPPANFTMFEALTVEGDFISGAIQVQQAVPDGGSMLGLTAIGSLALGVLRQKFQSFKPA